MLNQLKRDLLSKEDIKTTDLMLESLTDDDIRDAFLDNVELMLLGTENDSQTEQEVEKIPEYNEDELTKEELKELDNVSESVELIPEYDGEL